jgi:predicted nucleic acid-binding Zn ribbon protein
MAKTSVRRNVMQKIHEDPDNAYCFDCSSIDITHTSTSLGIILCINCAQVHNLLIPEISLIKRLDELLTHQESSAIENGGNAALKSFFAMYSIPSNDSIEYKYRTKACKYYKEMLKMMSSDRPCTMLTPNELEGPELADEYLPTEVTVSEPVSAKSEESFSLSRAVKSVGSFATRTMDSLFKRSIFNKSGSSKGILKKQTN